MCFDPLNNRSGIQIERAGITELVRGQEESLLQRLTPLVRSRAVILDLSAVERIDAAGIAALIRLYCLATEAGRSFAVAHVTAHVEEILHLVGLERLLAPRNEQDAPSSSLRMEMSAA